MSSPSASLSRHSRMRSARQLLFVLGDQLDAKLPALAELDRERDAVLMTEVRDEAEHLPSHRRRALNVLVDERGRPSQGKWNFDDQNREGPGYLRRNGLRHRGQLPQFYWTEETEMN